MRYHVLKNRCENFNEVQNTLEILMNDAFLKAKEYKGQRDAMEKFAFKKYNEIGFIYSELVVSLDELFNSML